jgi:hypothetical protein
MKKPKNPQKLHLNLNIVKPLSSIDLQKVHGGVNSSECSVNTIPP